MKIFFKYQFKPLTKVLFKIFFFCLALLSLAFAFPADAATIYSQNVPATSAFACTSSGNDPQTGETFCHYIDITPSSLLQMRSFTFFGVECRDSATATGTPTFSIWDFGLDTEIFSRTQDVKSCINNTDWSADNFDFNATTSLVRLDVPLLLNEGYTYRFYLKGGAPTEQWKIGDINDSISFEIYDNAQGEFPAWWFLSPTSTVIIFNPFSASGFTWPDVDCSSYEISLFSSSTLAGIGCVIKKSFLDVVGFFVVPTYSLEFFSESVDSFQSVFPFSIYFELQESLASAASSTPSSASSTLAWAFPIGGQTINIAVGSSTLTGAVGSTISTMYFTVVRMFLWLLLALGLWAFVHHQITRTNSDK